MAQGAFQVIVRHNDVPKKILMTTALSDMHSNKYHYIGVIIIIFGSKNN